MGKEEAIGIKVFGILWIILSIIFLAAFPIGMVILNFCVALNTGPVGLLLMGLVALVLNVLGVFIGVGLVKHKRWAKNLLFVFIFADVAALLFLIYPELDMLIRLIRTDLPFYGLRTTLFKVLKWILKTPLQTCACLLGIIFLISNLFYFTRPKVKELFR